MLEKETKRLGYKPNELLKDNWLESIIDRMSISSVDDLYSALGYGSVPTSQVLPKLKMLYNKEHNISEETQFAAVKPKDIPSKYDENRSSQGINIKGVDNIKARFAKCCNPVPGDEIIGFITKGRGVAIHRTDCPNISNSQDTERFIEVSWDDENKASYPAEIQIRADDRFGLLSEITQKITDSDIGLMGLNARTDKDQIAIINLTLEIKDIDDLKQLMKKVKKIESVIDVYRVTA